MHWPVICTAALQAVHAKRAHPSHGMASDWYRPCVGRQAAGDPVLQRDVVQAAHRLDHHTAWCGGRWHHLHRHQERLPVLRSASGLAAVALAARIGIVDLHETGQFAHGLALGHDLHDLVLHPQGAFVVDAQMAHQLQRDHVGLGRGQQLQGQHQVRSGSLVPWNIVPAIRLVWCRHALHW